MSTYNAFDVMNGRQVPSIYNRPTEQVQQKKK